MKTILTMMALALCLTINAQTVIQGNLLIESNTTLGSNCGQNNTETITYTGDLNFNGNYILTLKGVNLIIQGNINGRATIKSFCQNNQSDVCGNLQNASGIVFNGVSICGNTLSAPTFDINKDFGYNYTIYNLVTGQKIQEGITSQDMFLDAPKGVFLLLKVEGFKEEKRLIR